MKRMGMIKDSLEAIYEKFNINHPKDFTGHSLSVSDIVVLHENGENSAHFVDSFGFTGLPDFMRELEGAKEQGVEQAEPAPEKKSYPAIYGHSLEYVMEHGEVDDYMDSNKRNRECKRAIEGTIRERRDALKR